MTTYSFIDESGETRLVGTISPAPGGGSQTVKSKSVAFAFDTPGLADGIAIYTPTVDESLLMVIFYVLTAWNGTTPVGDFLPSDFAALACIIQVDMTHVVAQVGSGNDLLQTSLDSYTPYVFGTTAPLLIAVTDGSGIGNDPGASQGSGVAQILVGAPPA